MPMYLESVDDLTITSAFDRSITRVDGAGNFPPRDDTRRDDSDEICVAGLPVSNDARGGAFDNMVRTL